MKITLDELRAQRELLARHLKWLDEKIAKSESAGAQPLESPAAPEQPVEAAPAQTSPLPPVAPPRVPPQARTAVDAASDRESIVIPGEGEYRANTASQVRNAKIGCVALAVGAMALFLFLLFGLPYLLGGDNETETSDDAPETLQPANE